MIFENRQLIKLDGAGIEVEYASSGGAIERLELLRILQIGCERIGVAIDYNRRIESVEALGRADLIVGADGANSAVRAQFARAFGTRSHSLTNFMAWYGVRKVLKPNGLAFRKTRDGYFVGHYYAYTDTMSTFVAECDAATWRDAGLDAMTEPQRRACMEQVFAPELEGAPLVDNKSNFRNPQVITNDRWAVGNVVLLGDALRNAHPSIGSGTRLAMDDALALANALEQSGYDIAAGTAEFERTRRPVRSRLEAAMERSFLWYENLRTVMQQPIMDFVYDFLTRTGRVDDERLKVYAPAFYESYRQYRALATAGEQPS
jgi:2-polyprenyl-6-methoxyphenol hydroxylase-like FAD-dependent oxidoreductase